MPSLIDATPHPPKISRQINGTPLAYCNNISYIVTYHMKYNDIRIALPERASKTGGGGGGMIRKKER